MREPSDTLPAPRRRAIYLLPNLLTTGTVFAGFYGIVASIDGHYTPACIAVFIAALLDGMDGRLARLTHTESEFGKQYDSLADMVAFGMAPAIIVYQWGLKALAEYGWAWGKLGWLAAFLYTVAAALRLARFNVASKTTDRRFFEGLPSPSAAGLVASMVWLESQLGLGGLPALAVSTALTVSAGVLMVSRFAYYSFKELGPRGRISFAYVFVIPLVFVLIALDPPSVCFSIALLYALSGVVMALWRRRRRHSGRSRRNEGTQGPFRVREGECLSMSTADLRLTDQQLAALDAMGIAVWTRRIELTTLSVAVVEPESAWETLEKEALACTKCVLHKTRTQVVFGVGDRQARWMVIGEAPGADEDRQGEPFVGRAGQLLNEMLRAAGLAREQVYIANILKCRPPENRDPKPDESASCEGYLQRQIALVQPGLVLAVGRIAAQNLLREDTPIGRLRGRVHRYGPAGIPLVVTYHPAYLLRSPGQKRKAWEDLCLARATVPPLREPAQVGPATDER